MANVKDLLVNGSARVIGTIYGNATSANKVNHSLTFGSKSFNGSSAQTITLADLGGKPTQSAVSSPSASGTEISFIDTISQNANGVISATKKTVRDASASQSGVVNTGAQTFTGNKTFANGITLGANINMGSTGTPSSYPYVGNKITWDGGTDGAQIYYQINSSDAGRLFLNTTDDTNCLIALAYNGTAKSYINTSTPSFYPSSNNTGSIGLSSNKWASMYATTFYGALSGNATTATKLATARTIQTNLASTTSASFDGSTNIIPGVTGILGISNGGTGVTSIAEIRAGKDSDGNTIKDTYLKRYRNSNTYGSGYTDLNGTMPPFLQAYKNGYPLHTDPEFASGNNGIALYDNAGSGKTTVERIDMACGNSTGKVLRIRNIGSGPSPYLGGWYFGDITAYARQYVCIFRAKAPVGYTITWHSNPCGTNSKTYWVTDNAGTGKWEWYAYFVDNGSANFSSTMFFALSGTPGTTNAPVDWFLSYANTIILSYGAYDGLRTRYADNADRWTNSRTFITALNSENSASVNGSSNVTMGVSGTLPVSHGGTGQTSIANIQAGKDADGNTITSKYVSIYNSNNIGQSSSVTVNDLAKQGSAVGMIYAATDNPFGKASWVHVWSQAWNKTVNGSWVSQIALGVDESDGMWYRTKEGTIVGAEWKKVLDSNNYTSYTVTKTGSGASGTWGIGISGNAATATKLQTARTINGTNFDGSAAITTANWGIARTLTIGNTGKSVNGSGNVSWSLSEIGAAASSHNHTSLTGVTSIAFSAESSDSASIKTTIEGASTSFDFMLSDDLGQNDQWRWRFTPSGGTIYDAMRLKPTAQDKADLYVGGTKVSLEGHTHNYAGSSSIGGSANSAVKLDTTTAGDSNTPVYFTGGKPIACTSLDLSTSGNAATATVLQTARNITVGAKTNSFNGSANITFTPFESRLVRALYNTDSNLNDFANRGHALGMCSLGDNGPVDNPGGKTGWHHVINLTWIDAADNNGTTTNEWCTQIANACGSSDLYVRSRGGGSITNGTAWGAPWTKILTASNYTGTTDSRYVLKSGDTMTGQLNATAGLKWTHAYWNPGGNLYCIPTANNQEWSIDVGNSNYTGSLFHIWSAKNSASILECYADNRHVAIPVHLSVGGYNNTSYALSTSSLISQSWIRTTGATGWYNETYGGGWYMTDSTYLRSYNNKMVYSGGKFLSPSTASSWIDGQRYARGGYNLEDATDNGSYWPWMRQTNSNTGRWFSFGTLGNSFYWIGSSTSRTSNGYDNGMEFNVSNGYLTGCSRVYGAVWNDYAEYRKSDVTEPGRVVIENGDGTLSLSTKRLQRGAEVISDTYGFAIGKTDECKTPIAATGRVLAYTYEPVEEYKSKTGWPVCSGPNGTVSIMTEEEEEKYPSRIIGTISEVSDYEEWGTGKVKTNGRVWIRIK